MTNSGAPIHACDVRNVLHDFWMSRSSHRLMVFVLSDTARAEWARKCKNDSEKNDMSLCWTEKKKRGETVPALFLLNSFLFPFLADLFETVKRKRKQNNRNSIANVLSGLRINYAPNYLIELWAHLIFLLSNSILSSIEKRYLPLAARQLLAIRAMWAFATAFVRVHA